MIREVDLVSYLPPYLQEYNQETVAALEAENPEFRLIWGFPLLTEFYTMSSYQPPMNTAFQGLKKS